MNIFLPILQPRQLLNCVAYRINSYWKHIFSLSFAHGFVDQKLFIETVTYFPLLTTPGQHSSNHAIINTISSRESLQRL